MMPSVLYSNRNNLNQIFRGSCDGYWELAKHDLLCQTSSVSHSYLFTRGRGSRLVMVLRKVVGLLLMLLLLTPL